MKKKRKDCTCHECEISFTVTFIGRKTLQLCPFCGDAIDVHDDRPLLKDFDEYDEFDEEKYYAYDEEDFDE